MSVLLPVAGAGQLPGAAAAQTQTVGPPAEAAGEGSQGSQTQAGGERCPPQVQEVLQLSGEYLENGDQLRAYLKSVTSATLSLVVQFYHWIR